MDDEEDDTWTDDDDDNGDGNGDGDDGGGYVIVAVDSSSNSGGGPPPTSESGAGYQEPPTRIDDFLSAHPYLIAPADSSTPPLATMAPAEYAWTDSLTAQLNALLQPAMLGDTPLDGLSPGLVGIIDMLAAEQAAAGMPVASTETGIALASAPLNVIQPVPVPAETDFVLPDGGSIHLPAGATILPGPNESVHIVFPNNGGSFDGFWTTDEDGEDVYETRATPTTGASSGAAAPPLTTEQMLSKLVGAQPPSSPPSPSEPDWGALIDKNKPIVVVPLGPVPPPINIPGVWPPPPPPPLPAPPTGDLPPIILPPPKGYSVAEMREPYVMWHIDRDATPAPGKTALIDFYKDGQLVHRHDEPKVNKQGDPIVVRSSDLVNAKVFQVKEITGMNSTGEKSKKPIATLLIENLSTAINGFYQDNKTTQKRGPDPLPGTNIYPKINARNSREIVLVAGVPVPQSEVPRLQRIANAYVAGDARVKELPPLRVIVWSDPAAFPHPAPSPHVEFVPPKLGTLMLHSLKDAAINVAIGLALSVLDSWLTEQAIQRSIDERRPEIEKAINAQLPIVNLMAQAQPDQRVYANVVLTLSTTSVLKTGDPMDLGWDPMNPEVKFVGATVGRVPINSTSGSSLEYTFNRHVQTETRTVVYPILIYDPSH